jgi:hypothetical protein
MFRTHTALLLQQLIRSPFLIKVGISVDAMTAHARLMVWHHLILARKVTRLLRISSSMALYCFKNNLDLTIGLKLIDTTFCLFVSEGIS